MTDLVKCDRCGTPFSIQTAGIRATWSGDYMVQYFTLPCCHPSLPDSDHGHRAAPDHPEQ